MKYFEYSVAVFVCMDVVYLSARAHELLGKNAEFCFILLIILILECSGGAREKF